MTKAKETFWNFSDYCNQRYIRDSFNQCTTELERSTWRVFMGYDCHRILGGRKPTPAEQAILDEYGIYPKPEPK